jgi:hypothetical protein
VYQFGTGQLGTYTSSWLFFALARGGYDTRERVAAKVLTGQQLIYFVVYFSNKNKN